MKASIALLLVIIILILPISPLITQKVSISTKAMPIAKIKIEKTIDLEKNEKKIAINPIITLYCYSEIELSFSSTGNDLKYLILETTDYKKVISTAPPFIEASFASYNRTNYSFYLEFASPPSTLPINLTFEGTTGKITLEEIECFDNSIKHLDENWNIITNRGFTWHLLATQTWAELQISIPLHLKSIIEDETEILDVQLCFNWTNYCKNNIRLSSAEIQTNQKTRKITINEIQNYEILENPVLKIDFSPDHDFFSTSIELKINIWIRKNLNKNDDFSIEDIPFLPEWISIPLGVLLMVIPLAGVTKRPKAKIFDQTTIKDKNVE